MPTTAESKSAASGAPVVKPPRPLRLRVHSGLRWVHIYLSLFSLLIVLFFSVTGLTLNHPDWLGGSAERTRQTTGQVPAEWVRPGSASGVDKLAVVEFLRAKQGVRGALDTFEIDDRECIVAFKGPGYAADAFIDRASGKLQLTTSDAAAVAVMNDLHKGRHTGKVWSLAIDASAIFLSVLSATGIGLFLYLKRMRVAGLVTAAVGTLLFFALLALTTR